jgi:hypothetical protein
MDERMVSLLSNDHLFHLCIAVCTLVVNVLQLVESPAASVQLEANRTRHTATTWREHASTAAHAQVVA